MMNETGAGKQEERDQEDRKTRVFVYGTLKRGFGNHRFIAQARFLGRAITSKDYALYVSGIPYVVRDEPVSCIHGEVYAVDQSTLNTLDRLEGHPGWYRRELISVCLPERAKSERDIDAWIYFNPSATGKLVPDGQYR